MNPVRVPRTSCNRFSDGTAHSDRRLPDAADLDGPGRQLIVNLKTAKGLGITIPPSLLFRAKVETQVWAADSIP